VTALGGRGGYGRCARPGVALRPRQLRLPGSLAQDELVVAAAGVLLELLVPELPLVELPLPVEDDPMLAEAP